MKPDQTRAVTLFSGSSGNALLVESGKTRLLVDAGVCGRDIERAMAHVEADPRNLDGILVTHEHSDHVSGVGVLARRFRIPLYINQATWNALRHSIGKVSPDLVHLIAPGEQTIVKDLAFTSFRTPHDAVDPVGYRIDTGRRQLTVMTDIGHMAGSLVEAAAGSDLVFIEANYDPMMLEHGPYPRPLKERISGTHGHLSNEDCGRAIFDLALKGTARFVLSHLSRENNYPDLAMDTVVRQLAVHGIEVGRDIQIQVARRHQPGDPILL